VWNAIPDIDECALGTSLCTCNGLPGCVTYCTNTAGSHECGCGPGYVLDVDGITCIGSSTLYCPCSHITFKIGYYPVAFTFGSGFVSNNISTWDVISVWNVISDRNECADGTHACVCAPGLTGCVATCTNIPGTYVCGCSPGYMLDTDGLTCVGTSCCHCPPCSCTT
jgi:hypothetical protein